ncbi:MAG: homocysteine S-methyltransferase family protein [Paracoccaceae bacterium]
MSGAPTVLRRTPDAPEPGGSEPGPITLMDGGMGQELLARSGRRPTPLWSAEVMRAEPDLVERIHLDSIRAGARVIIVNSYSATRCRLARQGAEDAFEGLQWLACDLAARARDAAGAAGAEVAIAGCLPPLEWSYRPNANADPDDLAEAYGEIAALQGPHVDLMLAETIPSAIEGRGAVLGATLAGRPIWLAWTVADDPRAVLRSGENLTSAAEAVADLPVAAVLLNCSTPEAITTAMPALAAVADGRPFGAYANGFAGIAASFAPGTTVAELETRSDLSPEAYAEAAFSWLPHGATILGGCCEVSVAHIAHLAERLRAAGHAIRSGRC